MEGEDIQQIKLEDSNSQNNGLENSSENPVTMPNTNDVKTESHAIFAKFMHERYFQSFQYIQFNGQRADQSIQTYITIFTATIGVMIVVLTTNMNQAESVFWGTISAALLIIGIVGVITGLRFTATRGRRDNEKNRVHHIQNYFKRLDPDSFEKYQVSIQSVPQNYKYWFTPFLWAFGIIHCAFFAISFAIFAGGFVLSLGYLLINQVWWLSILGIGIFSASAIFYTRVSKILMRIHF